MEAVGAVFAELGGTVDVREIARRGGVGMGTLYRHFPTKDDLLATVLAEQFTAWPSRPPATPAPTSGAASCASRSTA